LDETYVRVKGTWKYLYRAVDKAGATVDFLLTGKPDRKAASRFLRKAIGRNGTPEKIAIDKSGANTGAIESHNVETEAGIEIRQIKYLTDVFDKSLSVAGVEIVCFSAFFAKRSVPLDSRESVAGSEVKAGRQATARYARLGLDGASTALSLASCGMDGD
jgi:DDE domain